MAKSKEARTALIALIIVGAVAVAGVAGMFLGGGATGELFTPILRSGAQAAAGRQSSTALAICNTNLATAQQENAQKSATIAQLQIQVNGLTTENVELRRTNDKITSETRAKCLSVGIGEEDDRTGDVEILYKRVTSEGPARLVVNSEGKVRELPNPAGDYPNVDISASTAQDWWDSLPSANDHVDDW